MKIKEVAFANADLQKAYFKLKEGKFEEKQIFDFVSRAINDLKENPFCGIRIPRDLWPKEYVKNYNIRKTMRHPHINVWVCDRRSFLGCSETTAP